MKNKDFTGASGGDSVDKAAERRVRQAAALRDNLKKRKQQIRARHDDGKTGGEKGPKDGGKAEKP